MNALVLHRAQSLGNQHPAALEIVVDEAMPTLGSLAEQLAVYVREGQDLADALIGSLPGGTVDQLVIRLLARRASLLAVPLFDSIAIGPEARR